MEQAEQARGSAGGRRWPFLSLLHPLQPPLTGPKCPRLPPTAEGHCRPAVSPHWNPQPGCPLHTLGSRVAVDSGQCAVGPEPGVLQETRPTCTAGLRTDLAHEEALRAGRALWRGCILHVQTPELGAATGP